MPFRLLRKKDKNKSPKERLIHGKYTKREDTTKILQGKLCNIHKTSQISLSKCSSDLLKWLMKNAFHFLARLISATWMFLLQDRVLILNFFCSEIACPFVQKNAYIILLRTVTQTIIDQTKVQKFLQIPPTSGVFQDKFVINLTTQRIETEIL